MHKFSCLFTISHEGFWWKGEIQAIWTNCFDSGKVLSEEQREYLLRHLGHSAAVHE